MYGASNGYFSWATSSPFLSLLHERTLVLAKPRLVSLASSQSYSTPAPGFRRPTRNRRDIMYMLAPKLVKSSVWYIGIIHLPRPWHCTVSISYRDRYDHALRDLARATSRPVRLSATMAGLHCTPQLFLSPRPSAAANAPFARSSSHRASGIRAGSTARGSHGKPSCRRSVLCCLRANRTSREPA